MSLNQTVVFRMNGNARAELVAKQMKKVLAEIGRQPKLSFCREAVARMYGHADWSSLCTASFDELSPDDTDVGETECNARHDQQRAVLMKMGLSAQASENIRVRLSPTGRSERDVEALKPVKLQFTSQYHPVRLMESLDGVARGRYLYSLHESGVDVRRLSEQAIDRGIPRYSYSDLLEDVLEWSEDRLSPLDSDVLEEYPLEILAEDAQSVRDAEAVLLDAGSVAQAFADVDVADETYAGAFDGMPKTFVHFGTNAFPSPWPGCGIEGCYVTIVTPKMNYRGGVGMETYRRIEFTFVVSPETCSDPRIGYGEMMFRGHQFYDLVCDLRHLPIQTEAQEDNHEGPVRLGDAIDTADGVEFGEDYADAWKPYLRRPLNAAWNAIRALREGSHPVVDGMISDLPDELFKKLSRARTEAQRLSVSKEIGAYGEQPVRFLGAVSDVALNGFVPVPQLDAPLPQLDDPVSWALGYVRMAEAAHHHEMRLDMARRAIAIMSLHAGSDGNEVRACAHIQEQEALSDLGRWKEALTAARRCLEIDPRDGNGMRFRMATLLVRNDEAKGAAELLARFDRENGSGALEDWSRALLHAKFGTDDQARASLSKAVAEGTGVRELLLGGDGFRERWYDREMVMAAHEDGSGEAYVVAGVHRDGWDAVPPHRSGGFGTKKPRRSVA